MGLLRFPQQKGAWGAPQLALGALRALLGDLGSHKQRAALPRAGCGHCPGLEGAALIPWMLQGSQP